LPAGEAGIGTLAAACTGWNAHQARPSSIDIPDFAAGAAGPAGPSGRGSTAPAAIHRSKSAITRSGSLPDGGISISGSV
jgi:hypothetical protein